MEIGLAEVQSSPMNKDQIFFIFENELAQYRRKLFDHEIYTSVTNIQELKLFMESHVFAVWDFMSLAKRLQISITCVDIPWIPPFNSNAARFINSIILNEETDLTEDSLPSSHLEMYLEAMKEVGASTDIFYRFIDLIGTGYSLDEACKLSKVPEHVSSFVKNTIETALHGSTAQVASAFLHGREDPIPEMFSKLIDNLGKDCSHARKLRWYLKRHIELDGSDHGPVARELLVHTMGGDITNLRIALQAAKTAISHRIQFWDGILSSIRSSRPITGAFEIAND